jgi:hypothetical protein
MNKLLAVAYLTIREAVRSRLMAALAVFLFAAVFWLSISIRGDGTLEGRVQVLLEYGLGAAFAILAVATLGIAAASVSGDIEEKTIQLIAVKPLPRWGIWFGRWLGLLTLNAVLLSLCAGIAYGIVSWHLRVSSSTTSEQASVQDNILTARRLIPAQPPNVEVQARAVADRLIQESGAENISPSEALADARRQMILAYQTVGPLDSRQWAFEIPAEENTLHPLLLRIQFRHGSVDRIPMTGRWLVRSPTTTNAVAIAVTNLSAGVHRLALPADIANGRRLTVTFENGAAGASGPVVFHGSRGVELLVGAHDFGPNLLRAVGLLFLRLALLAAIGLTAGAAFSTPVATFMAAAFAIMGILVQYSVFSATPDASAFADHHHDEDSFLPQWVETIMTPVARVAAGIITPAIQYDPLGALADGQWISLAELLKAFAVLVLLYGGAAAGIGVWILRRRELALPG